MNEVLAKKLLDDFPQIFRDCHESVMQRNFACGDGWFELIYKLCQDIESVARENGFSPDSSAWPQCREIKSKMGSLRFVVFAVKGHEEMNERISALRNLALNQSVDIPEFRNIDNVEYSLKVQMSKPMVFMK